MGSNGQAGRMSSTRSPRAYYTSPMNRPMSVPLMTPRDADHLAPLVVSIRPTNDHASMRRAAAGLGFRVLALSPWSIAVRSDGVARAALDAALAADLVIATSPAAVRAAGSLTHLRARRLQTFCAVGSATAYALRRAGIVDVVIPDRMDSEGLLSLPALQHVKGCSIGLLTAPGGRDLIATVLRERGAEVRRADVYQRVTQPLSTASIRRLRAYAGPLLLPVSSGEALLGVLAGAPADIAARLRNAGVLVASVRLAALAREAGCVHVHVAAGPRPAQLLAAAFGHA